MPSQPGKNAKTYAKLKPWYEKTMVNGMSCHQIASESGLTYNTVLQYYTRYLRERFEKKEKQREKQCQREIQKEPICPTCGKLKSEVTNPEVCRDYLHFKE